MSLDINLVLGGHLYYNSFLWDEDDEVPPFPLNENGEDNGGLMDQID